DRKPRRLPNRHLSSLESLHRGVVVVEPAVQRERDCQRYRTLPIEAIDVERVDESPLGLEHPPPRPKVEERREQVEDRQAKRFFISAERNPRVLQAGGKTRRPQV